MAPVFGGILLPLIGICVGVVSVFAFTRPSSPLKEKTQRIKGFGLDLEVSVLTLIVLIGLTFSLAGIYLVTRDYDTTVKALSGAREDLKRARENFDYAIDQAKKI